MSRIKEKLSALVSQQLPEFVRSDYTLFVSFLEAYYRFLEQDQNAQEIVQNARNYNDIDRTAASFVQYFLKNYGTYLPQNIIANKQLLIKRLNNLYASKGSELSFKTLFRILFNSDVTLKKPYDFVLRPSDGLWEQQVSIRVKLTTGSVDDILNRNLVLFKNNIYYYASIYRVKELTNNIFEIFFKSQVTPPYEIDDIVYVEDLNGQIFSGTIDPTTTGYEIINGGTGFKAGQIFTINLEGALNTVVQIKSVNSVGSITALKFINYGYNFPNSTISIDLYNDLTIASRSFSVVTKTNSLTDKFQAVLTYLGSEAGRYFLTDYVEQGYNGELLTEVTSNPGQAGTTSFTQSTLDQAAATLSFTMGAVGRYPGQFSTNRGFISEPDVRLQDSLLYQPFAYLLETEEDISKFYDIVKALIHPAGTNLFNNRIISANANIKANISVITRSNIFSEVYDTFDVLDNSLKTLYRSFADNTTTALDDVYTLYKPVNDSLTPSDSSSLVINITISDTTSITDEISKTIDYVVKNLAEDYTLTQNYFAEDYTIPAETYYDAVYPDDGSFSIV